MAADYAQRLGQSLRFVRRQRSLTLRDVEERSNGRWKAAVIGSWERGARAITVAKLAELAEFYAVPTTDLLPDSGGAVVPSDPPLILDLRRLTKLTSAEAKPMARYVKALQSERGDYNGKVLTIRGQDVRALAIVYDLPAQDLIEKLVGWKMLLLP